MNSDYYVPILNISFRVGYVSNAGSCKKRDERKRQLTAELNSTVVKPEPVAPNCGPKRRWRKALNGEITVITQAETMQSPAVVAEFSWCMSDGAMGVGMGGGGGGYTYVTCMCVCVCEGREYTRI